MGQLGELDIGATTPKFAVINQAAADATIVAAVAGKKIRVTSFIITSDTVDTLVLFESTLGGDALTGDMRMGDNGVISSGFNPMGHFETVSGELLNLQSTVGSVDGVLTYIEVD